MEGGGEEEFVVAHRWTRAETVVLVNALKAREEEAHDVASKSAVGTASDKWEWVSKFCRSHGVPRSSAQCNSRWSKGLYLDYRKVRDWQRKKGVEPYWKMKERKRRENKLPGALDEEVYSILVSFLDPDLKQTGTPESEVDSDRPLQLVSMVPVMDKEPPESSHQQAGPSVPGADAGASPLQDSDGGGSMSDFARLQARGTGGESLHGPKSQSGGSPEDDKFPAAPGHKRKRASIAPPSIGAIPAMMVGADGRVIHVVDTSKEPSMEPIKPIHFNVPPVIDGTRSDERPASIAERTSRSDWDVQQSLSALEARLGAQNEAVWSRIRMLNEQVVQVVDMSNQRLQGQLQSLFTQIRMQLQVISAQMQAQVHESTRAVQAELQTLLQAHSDQVYSQLQLHYSVMGSHVLGQPPLLPKDRPTTTTTATTTTTTTMQNGSWESERVLRPSPPEIQVDFSKLPVPPLQPMPMPIPSIRDKERSVRQKIGEHQHVSEGLPAPPPRTNRLLPHISDVQKVENVAPCHQTRLLPHIHDVDRILRQQQQAMPAPSPSWNETSFVISELDRVLGHNRPLNIPIVPSSPAPSLGGPTKCTYVVNESDRLLRQRHPPSGDVKIEKTTTSVSPSSVGLNDLGRGLSGHFHKEVDMTGLRHGWQQQQQQEGPIHGAVLALPRVLRTLNPNPTTETSSDPDADPNSTQPASSDTVDGEETQDSGQDMGASSEKASSNHSVREAQVRPPVVDNLPRV